MSHRVRFTEPDAGAQLDVVDAVVTVKVQASDTDGSYELFELTGGAGSGAPKSRHPWAEAYYVIDGSVTVAVGGRTYALEPGACVTIPPNAAHSLEVTSGVARMLVLSLGPRGGKFFSEMNEHVHLADGPEVFVPHIVEVAQRNEVTLL